jgi:hypothetical protein
VGRMLISLLCCFATSPNPCLGALLRPLLTFCSPRRACRQGLYLLLAAHPCTLASSSYRFPLAPCPCWCFALMLGHAMWVLLACPLVLLTVT